MTDLAVIAAVPETIGIHADPGAYVVECCDRARTWLSQALEHGEIDRIVELKSQAEAIRVYTVQKQYGKDAELAAAEIVRRAERGIGVCIRRGQEAGTIARRGQTNRPANQYGSAVPPEKGNSRLSPAEFLAGSDEVAAVYAVTDNVTDDQFETALAEAKSEQNLSRANVVRKVKPEAKAKPADRHEVHYKARRIDSNRVVSETVGMLEGAVSGLALVEIDDLTLDEIDGWTTSLKSSLKALSGFLKEMTQRVQS